MDLEEWQLDSPKLYLNLESVQAGCPVGYPGKRVGVGQDRVVVVGASFYETERGAFRLAGRESWGVGV